MVTLYDRDAQAVRDILVNLANLWRSDRGEGDGVEVVFEAVRDNRSLGDKPNQRSAAAFGLVAAINEQLPKERRLPMEPWEPRSALRPRPKHTTEPF